MRAETHPWENLLLSLAYEAHHSEPVDNAPIADGEQLRRAYQHCDAITAVHSRSFHMASALLPAAKRQAARALYAFCRISDDIVDSQQEGREQRLGDWRRQVMAAHPPADDLVLLAWADARRRYGIPMRYAEQLLDGVASDLARTRYSTFDELAAYSYGVASTVGLMSMHIIGFQDTAAIPYAIKLGVALQMTNILRDVAADWQVGRVYLPQQELSEFGLTEVDIAEGAVSARWRRFMRFQIDRNRRLYAEGTPGVAHLDRDGRFAIMAAAELYQAILDDIEAHDYDVFSRRAHVRTVGKLRRLPTIWWHSRRVRRPALLEG